MRGDAYRMLDRYYEAVADLTRALELDPDDADALASRGDSYRLLGRCEEAVADLTLRPGARPGERLRPAEPRQ